MKYTVWVGGVEVNDHLLTKEEADVLAENYKNDGYDDVQIESVMDYEGLYDQIQDVTNEIMNTCSPMFTEEFNEETREMFRELCDIAVKLSDKAHLLEEHLAWDECRKEVCNG